MFDQKAVDEYLNKIKEVRLTCKIKGAWDKEEDRVLFKHKGFNCMVQRGPLLNLCGYVGLHPGHPWYDKPYMDKYDEENYETIIEEGIPATIHGGITYAERCDGAVCHLPEPGEPDELYWIGFDCAHLCHDFVPVMYRHLEKPLFKDTKYRDMEWVTTETKDLANQAA